MRLTEQIQLKKSNSLSRLGHLAKNLYNEANYLVRQHFFHDRHWIRYTELYWLLKSSKNYRILPIQSAQQILRVLEKNWWGFFQAIKDWKRYPHKYRGRPIHLDINPKTGSFLFTSQTNNADSGMDT